MNAAVTATAAASRIFITPSRWVLPLLPHYTLNYMFIKRFLTTISMIMNESYLSFFNYNCAYYLLLVLLIFIQEFPFDFRKYTYFHAFFIKISKYIINSLIISVNIIIIHFLKAFFI